MSQSACQRRFSFPAQVYTLRIHPPSCLREPLTLQRGRPSPPGDPGKQWAWGCALGEEGGELQAAVCPRLPRTRAARSPRLRAPVRIPVQPDDSPGRPFSRRRCQGPGGVRRWGVRPSPRPQIPGRPRAGTFSGFQKEHFLSCLIFSSFKCKWRGFAPRLA